MTTIIQGGEAAIRHHRARLIAELDATEQQATRLAHRIRKLRAKSELLQAAITADTTVLTRLDRLARAEKAAADKKVAAAKAKRGRS